LSPHVALFLVPIDAEKDFTGSGLAELRKEHEVAAHFFAKLLQLGLVTHHQQPGVSLASLAPSVSQRGSG